MKVKNTPKIDQEIGEILIEPLTQEQLNELCGW